MKPSSAFSLEGAGGSEKPHRWSRARRDTTRSSASSAPARRCWPGSIYSIPHRENVRTGGPVGRKGAGGFLGWKVQTLPAGGGKRCAFTRRVHYSFTHSNVDAYPETYCKLIGIWRRIGAARRWLRGCGKMAHTQAGYSPMDPPVAVSISPYWIFVISEEARGKVPRPAPLTWTSCPRQEKDPPGDDRRRPRAERLRAFDPRPSRTRRLDGTLLHRGIFRSRASVDRVPRHSGQDPTRRAG